MINRTYSRREVLGAALLDLPRILPRLLRGGDWVGIHNRHDRVAVAPAPALASTGMKIDSPWTSAIHACRVFPWLGHWVLGRAFAQWPIRFATDGGVRPGAEEPDLTFILPFRGRERLPLLRLVAESILAQEGVKVECLVVEQSNEQEAVGQLPPGVRYLHLPHPEADPGWRKSWAFNTGARAARAPVLVCHDADILVPAGYGRAICAALAQGVDSIHIQRFLFYLSQADTAWVLTTRALGGCVPLKVVQNWQGGTLAIRREAFIAIGGFDERFVDWGGEDNEFFDRCLTLPHWGFGYVPFVHLWHPPQASKFGPERAAAVALMHQRLAIPRRERAVELAEQFKDMVPKGLP